jgi:16S rRNA C967 or C1407 C5-methylase (RsmB/RsmF family)/NOL1/NOP2/fmu family ribosome biogenesis protein
MDKISNFPTSFKKRVLNDEFLGEKLLIALNSTAPTSIRFNPTKIIKNECIENQISWCNSAYFLEKRPVFTLDPLFHAGTYYPQEAGSMILDKILQQLNLPEQPIVLDLCAAPGGKSTLIASFLKHKGLLISNEIINNRSKILKENLTKWGFTNTLVSNNDPKDFSRLPNFFDCIVVDAPCSGEGMFRKDIKSRQEWSEENVELCAGRQKKIVKDVWESLKPGGKLIYSTCTFNTQENEDNVEWFKQNLDCEIVTLDYSPFTSDRMNFGAYALPNQIQAEGFYIAVIQKNARDFKLKKFKCNTQEIKLVKDYSFLSNFVRLENIKILVWNSIYFAVPELYVNDVIELHEKLRLNKMGTELGTVIRGELIPDVGLALDVKLCNYPEKIDLNKELALKYLKGETFDIESSKAYKLITFEGINLAWMKHLGNRFNNLYPKEWRIRMNIE